MHDLPLHSSFLTEKFIRLSAVADVHLLVWDTKGNLDRFIAENKLATSQQKKIHLGIEAKKASIKLLPAIIWNAVFNRTVRTFLFDKHGSAKRMKMLLHYWPVASIKPDIIHFEFGTLAKDLDVLKELSTAKLTTSFRGYDINYVGLESNNYYDDVWTYTDGLHFLGNDLRDRAVKRGYQSNKKEAIISPAIDLSFFNGKQIEEPQKKLILFSSGRLVWKKGYEYALLAMQILKSRNIPFEYRIAGDGSQMQALLFYIHELGLQNDVILLGKQSKENIKDELNRANLFIHPAISEGFCNAVIEAQAMGVPVICTDADGLRENIEDGVTGFVVNKWDPIAIADKAEWFWHNPKAIKPMGEAGIKRAHEYYQIEKQIEAFQNFYKELTNL